MSHQSLRAARAASRSLFCPHALKRERASGRGINGSVRHFSQGNLHGMRSAYNPNLAKQLSESGRKEINPLDQTQMRRQKELEISRLKRRMRLAGAGLAFSFLGLVITTWMFPANEIKAEAPPNAPDFPADSSAVTVAGQSVDLVETGTSSVPYFPRTITLPTSESTKTAALPSGTGDSESEYTLLGLGIRTVSFLSIQVYVVGIYVASPDLATLQASFVREGAGSDLATALIAGEKDELKKKLLDHNEGEAIWDRVLDGGKGDKNGIRSVIRIVPVRNTDFGHLRDGFERNINARVRAKPEWAEDDKMGAAVAEFKAMLGRGKFAKGEECLLERGREGELRAWFKGNSDREWATLGTVKDERISRSMLLGYLAGKKVASEPCRVSVVDGVINVVERPVGTAETQVL